MKNHMTILLSLLIAALTKPTNGNAQDFLTVTEKTDFRRTSTYAETVDFYQRLEKASPYGKLIVFGQTSQRRDLHCFIVSKDKAFTPEAAAKTGKVIMLVQNGIHAGEIDGKDAGMMLLRDIAFGSQRHLVDHVNLVFVPIFNVDGHERSGPFNRPNQRGPNNQGWRNTAQNLNLNRDYVKADAPEMRAMLGYYRFPWFYRRMAR